MRYSRKTWLHRTLLFGLLSTICLVSTACNCNPTYRLTFENQMPTDVTIVHEDINKNGEQFYQATLGTVPAGQTARLNLLIPLFKGHSANQNYLQDYTVQLKAEDPTGNLVWQKAWPIKEFLDLKEGGWRIVISPQPDS